MTNISGEQQQLKILILAAIPDRLRLDKEIKKIRSAIERAQNRDIFKIEDRTAVRPQDIRRAIAEEKPQIVHFCGHGEQDGSLRLEDDGGNNKSVAPSALASLFKLHADYVQCVVLNACHSEKPAEAISQYISYVIGMNNSIQDNAATVFSEGFYDGLGYISNNQDVFQRGFDEGMVAIQMENPSQGSIPVLKKNKFTNLLPIPEPIDPDPYNIIQTQPFQFQTATLNVKPGLFGRTNCEINPSRRQAKSFKEDLGNNVLLEMVEIPGGSFLMGSPDNEPERLEREGPQHIVTVQPFFMGKFPITQVQYQAIMGKNPSRFKGINKPVECVSWDNAVEFCDIISQRTGKTYRLPSEAEWEYACRAGTTTPFYFGETITTDLANYNGKYTYGSAPKSQYRRETTDVGNFPANAFGLYDMHGYVHEWCEDAWHENYSGAPNDGSAWISNNDKFYRMLRGGCWNN